MASLSNYIDRLSQHAKSIRNTATATATSSTPTLQPGGPFTHALLSTSLGDLIRDVDPSELGLFTLIAPGHGHGASHAPERDARVIPKGQISRVEFHGATPLRPRRNEFQKVKEPEPEIYAQAALKYLDRYQSIRPMPRARAEVDAIIEDLATLRESVQSLSQTLEQVTKAVGTSDAPSSPKSLANLEERRLQDLQSRIAELKKRKESATKQRGVRNKLAQHSALPAPCSKPPPPKPDTQEVEFWTTPAAPARTLHFTDNLLMDEQVDLEDVSGMSFSSPVHPRGSIRASLSDREGVLEENEDGMGPSTLQLDRFDQDEIDTHEEQGQGQESPEDEGEEGEETIVLTKPLTPPSPSLPPPSSPAVLDGVSPDPEPEPPMPSSHVKKTPRIKINNEMERIVAKIWLTVGEIIMPGHPFDVTGTSINKPPRAKETIAHLQSLASQTPSPSSPSASSLSSFTVAAVQPTTQTTSTQQILTASLLLTLLGTPPSFAMPLNRLKDALATGAGGAGAGGGTRALYGCVAKRLVRIDRGGGEQIVKFDV